MALRKKDYYRERAQRYELIDPEATIRYRRAMRWIDIQPGVVVRELGCKFAALREEIGARLDDVDYLGVDIDDDTLRRIPDYDARRFLAHDLNDGLPFPDASVDYVVALEVVEHLESASHFLREVRRVLRADGRLIMSVPNPYSWSEVLQNLRHLPDTEGHVASFTHLNIDALVRFERLRLLDVQGTSARVPLTRRVLGRYTLVETDAMALTRSYLYLIGR